MKQIRLWKLGSLEKCIFPTREGVEKLISLINTEEPDKNLDIIWGPDLQLEIYEVEKVSEDKDYINYLTYGKHQPKIISFNKEDEVR